MLSPLLDLQISIAGGPANYFYLVGFFLLAFSSTRGSTRLSEQLAWPVILFLVIPMIMIGATTSNPDGTVVRVLSLFPMTSPIVMFQRL